MEPAQRDPAEEFEAVWAVVRRLEARIRRLEASVASLDQELSRLRSGEPAPGAFGAALDAGSSTGESGVPVPTPPAAQQDAAPTGVSTYRVVFDGGSIGNPGHGYGSYHVTDPSGGTLHERLDFDERGDKVTNNQAEYLALIHALERLHEVLGDRAGTAAVEILGDSQLVVNQLNGRWKVKNLELQPLHARATSLLAGFGRTSVTWHGRSNSVRLLGH